MEYERKYKAALKWMQSLYSGLHGATKEEAEHYFPELKDSEDERIVKCLLNYFNHVRYNGLDLKGTDVDEVITWLENQGKPEDKGEISDGYHTFNELYRYRLLYNAAFFNLLPKELVHKSKKHHDGEECFGGGWFIVMANLPTGQISNHYELKYWDLFQIPEKEIADEWDGHTPQEAADRLHEYLLEKRGKQNPIKLNETDEKIRKAIISILKGETGYTTKEVTDKYITWLKKQGEKVTNINGEDCGIDGLYHAIKILERTVGRVTGYQSDDGILEHKAAINAVKDLYEKQGEIEPKTLYADKVIAWLVANICDFEYYVTRFKKNFGL